MKIAYFSPAWPASEAQNGIATYVDLMVRSLREKGHDCVVITPQILTDEVDEWVYKVGDAPQTSALGFLARLRWRMGDKAAANSIRYCLAVAETLKRISASGPIDIVEMEETFGRARLLQRLIQIPIVTRLHGPHVLVHQDDKDAAYEKRVKLEGEAIKTARAISCPSQGVLDGIEDRYGPISAPKTVIPNPVSFGPDAGSWRVDQCDRNMILFVGRFDRIKGADIMLDAFQMLAEKYPALRLVMAGSDVGLPTSNGDVLKFGEYSVRYSPESIRTRIKFLGRVSRDRLDNLRRKAFACVSTSRFECFPYAVNEALAVGTPVISTSTFGPLEFLKHGKDILLADIDDAEQIAAHVVTMLENPERAAAIGEAGFRAAQNYLSPSDIADRAIDFYAGIIRSR